MRIKLIPFLVLLYFTVAAEAQSNHADNKSDHPAHSYKKILIVSLIRVYDFRVTVEDEISWWLRDKGFDVYSCNKFFPSQDLPSNKAINNVIEKNDFDAVLISDVKDIKDRERFEDTQQRYNYDPGKPKIYYYFDSYNNAYNQGYTYNTKSYQIDTKLFDVKSEEVVFEVKSTTYESVNLDEAIEKFAKSLANTIKKSKLLVRSDSR